MDALQRLFRREKGSPRLFRHQFYAHIAEGAPEVWSTCGTEDQRVKAVRDPKTLKQGSRPASVITKAWDLAMADGVSGVKFTQIRGDVPGQPCGYWTTELTSMSSIVL